MLAQTHCTQNECRLRCILQIPPVDMVRDAALKRAAEEISGDIAKHIVGRATIVYGAYDTGVCLKKCNDEFSSCR